MDTPQRKAQLGATLFLIGGIVLVAVPFWPGARESMIPIRTCLFSAWMCSFLLFFLIKRPFKEGVRSSSACFKGFLLSFGVLLGAGLLATTQAQVPQESLMTLLKWGLILSWFLTAWLILIQFPETKTWLFKAMVPLAGVLALVGIFQVMFQSAMVPANPQLPSGTFFYRNLYGSALFLTFPFLLWHLFQENRSWKIASVLVGILCFITLFLCRSGNAVLALLLFFPLFLQLRRNRNGNSNRPLWFRVLLNPLSLLLAMLLIGAVIFLIRFPGSTLQQRFRLAVPQYENIQPKSNSMQERVVLWRKSARMVLDHPWLGVGPGSWKVKISEYGLIAKNQRYGDRFFVRPHNDFLFVQAEYGIGGLLAWVGMWVVVLGYAVKLIRNVPGQQIRTELAAAVYGICGYLFISLFSYPGDRIFHPVMVFLFCALIFSHSLPGKVKGSEQWVIWLIPMLIMAGLSGVVSMEQVRVNHWLGKTHKASELQNFPQMAQFAENAHSPLVKLDPLSALPIIGYAAQANIQLGELESAEKQNNTALQLNPWHVQLLYQQVQILEAQGKTEEAEAAYQNLRKLYPPFRR